MKTTINEKDNETKFPKRDQFAPELDYFAECIHMNKEPEPSGLEGLCDLRIIEAIFRSARTKRAVRLQPARKAVRPTKEQEIRRPAHGKPQTLRAPSPHQ